MRMQCATVREDSKIVWFISVADVQRSSVRYHEIGQISSPSTETAAENIESLPKRASPGCSALFCLIWTEVNTILVGFQLSFLFGTTCLANMLGAVKCRCLIYPGCVHALGSERAQGPPSTKSTAFMSRWSFQEVALLLTLRKTFSNSQCPPVISRGFLTQLKTIGLIICSEHPSKDFVDHQ